MNKEANNKDGLDGGRAVLYKDTLYLNSYMGDLSLHSFDYGNVSFSEALSVFPVNGR